jgi:hypothetical protein
MCVCHDPGPLFHLRRPLTALADSSLAMVPRPQSCGSPSTPASSSMNFQHLENSSDEPQLNKQQSSHGSDTRPDTSITITCCACGSTVWLEEADVPNRRSCDGKSWKPTLPAGAVLVKPNCRVPGFHECGKSISSALSTKMVDHGAVLPSCSHIVTSWVSSVIYISPFSITIEAHTLCPSRLPHG